MSKKVVYNHKRTGKYHLTKLVLAYKKTKKEFILPIIQKHSRGLIKKVFSYYGINYFPTWVQEDIEGDCNSFILMRAIEQFDVSKGNFSTFYTWKLKSHIRGRKEYYMFRKKLVSSYSLDETLSSDPENASFADLETTSDLIPISKIRKAIKEVFNL